MHRPKQPHLLFDAFNLGNYLFVDLFMPDFIYFWIQLLFERFQSEYDVLIVLLSLAGCGWYFYWGNWPMQSWPFWIQSSIISFGIDSNLSAKAAPLLIHFICSSFSFNRNNAVKRLFVLIIAKRKKTYCFIQYQYKNEMFMSITFCLRSFSFSVCVWIVQYESIECRKSLVECQ